MEETEGFYDFSIPYTTNENKLREIIQESYELGYKTVAIEQQFDHSKKPSAKGPDIFPEPCNIKNLQDHFKNKLRILQRLTIIYTDSAITHAMGNSLNVKKYNLIAGQPKTDAALTHCCTIFPGDMICFDPENGAKLIVHRKSYSMGVKRGMYFEIKYAFAIRNSNNRKDMIKIAHTYCTRGKSKNIIFSSGALSPFEVRGPYDVANLAFIFGLSEDQGKNAVNRFCRHLFLKAESRRIGKTIMFVKCKGPVVFSDTDSDGSDEDFDNITMEGVTKDNESDNDPMSDTDEQPNKKLKTS